MIVYRSSIRERKTKAQKRREIEAWLSLVERCVRDAEVASSNLVASIHFSLFYEKGRSDRLLVVIIEEIKASWSSG